MVVTLSDLLVTQVRIAEKLDPFMLPCYKRSFEVCSAFRSLEVQVQGRREKEVVCYGEEECVLFDCFAKSLTSETRD